MNSTANKLDLQQKIIAETAKIAWSSLQKFYAAGRVIWVSDTLDLVEVAMKFVEDDIEAIQNILVCGKIEKLSQDKAKQWHEQHVELWATVIAPWVLVQHKR